jgi:56kDa selenium binding protein (SBP56)
MRATLLVAGVLLAAGCSEAPSAPSLAPNEASGSQFLFVWAGDKDKVESDFLSVVDLRDGAPTYGDVVATLPVGATGTMPHHTEYEFPESGMLFADGWASGLTSLIDLRDPLQPKLVKQFKDMGELAFPHSYARLGTGNVLVTLQGMNGKYGAPGGLAELAPDGKVLRTASARSADTADDLVWPYSLAVVPGKDRAVVALAEMGMPGQPYDSTHQVQVWTVSDLKVLATIDLPPSGRGEHHVDPAEPRVLADGTVYVGTFSCGVYRIDGVTEGDPKATFVHAFPGGDTAHNACAVPVVVGDYYVQTVPEINGLIALDVSDPMKPVEASRITFDAKFSMPHWVAADRKSDRLVVTGNNMSWAVVVTIVPATGAMKVDETLPDGVNFDRSTWPHGETGPAVVHGALFGG